jgi:hypothetical protein
MVARYEIERGRWGVLMLLLGMWAILFEIGRAILERGSFHLKECVFLVSVLVLEIAMIWAGAKL